MRAKAPTAKDTINLHERESIEVTTQVLLSRGAFAPNPPNFYWANGVGREDSKTDPSLEVSNFVLSHRSATDLAPTRRLLLSAPTPKLVIGNPESHISSLLLEMFRDVIRPVLPRRCLVPTKIARQVNILNLNLLLHPISNARNHLQPLRFMEPTEMLNQSIFAVESALALGSGPARSCAVRTRL